MCDQPFFISWQQQTRSILAYKHYVSGITSNSLELEAEHNVAAHSNKIPNLFFFLFLQNCICKQQGKLMDQINKRLQQI